MKAVQKYIADDGTEFDTAEAAREHDQQLSFTALVGLTADALEDAIAGRNPAVAEGIKRAYARLNAARMERGEVKRRAKASEMAAGAVHEPGTNGDAGTVEPAATAATVGMESVGAAVAQDERTARKGHKARAA